MTPKALLQLNHVTVTVREVTGAKTLLDRIDFEIPELKQFFRELGQMNVSGQPVTWPLALDRIHNDSVKNDLAAIASFKWALEDQAKAYEDCRMNIKRKKIESKLTGLRQKIAELEKQKKLDELTAVMKEYQDLLKQKKAIV